MCQPGHKWGSNCSARLQYVKTESEQRDGPNKEGVEGTKMQGGGGEHYYRKQVRLPQGTPGRFKNWRHHRKWG